jgi:hypothetical protein
MADRESPAEVQLRLHHEKECRRIAEIVVRELPANMGFVLVTATKGGGPGATFSSTQYIANIDRDDSARLLSELLDHWQDKGTGTQPTVAIATLLREFVHSSRNIPVKRLLHGARCSVRDIEAGLTAKTDVTTVKALLIKGAAELLAVLDQLQRPKPEGN